MENCRKGNTIETDDKMEMWRKKKGERLLWWFDWSKTELVEWCAPHTSHSFTGIQCWMIRYVHTFLLPFIAHIAAAVDLKSCCCSPHMIGCLVSAVINICSIGNSTYNVLYIAHICAFPIYYCRSNSQNCELPPVIKFTSIEWTSHYYLSWRAHTLPIR